MEAEPHARGFYERMGASYIRDSDVTEWGRVLEVLGLTLKPDAGDGSPGRSS